MIQNCVYDCILKYMYFMKNFLNRFIVRFIALVVLLTSIPVSMASGMNSNSNSVSSEQQKKKRPAKKKKPSKKKTKKSDKKKKRSRVKSKTKRKPTKKRRPPSKKKPSRKPKAAPKKEKTDVTIRESKKVSIYELSDDIYSLTHELDKSMRRLNKAKLILKPFEPERGDKYKIDKLRLAKEKVSQKPSSSLAQRELALEYERKGLFANARDIYLRMIALEPSNADYHYFLGSLYSKSGQHRKGRFSYEEVLEIDPNHTATINAISLYADTPEGEKMAEELYDKAATRAPQGPASLLSEIRDYISKDRLEEALAKSQEGKSRFPNNFIFPYLEGQSLEALGKIEEAKKSYKYSMTMDRTDPAATIALADLYFSQGNYLYAAVNYESVLSLQPLDVSLRFQHGLSYFKAHEWNKASSAWEDLLHYTPNHPEVRHMLPQTYYIMSLEYTRNGYTDLGRRSFANALSVNANSNDWLGDALKMIGEYYRENGLYRNALHAFQDAIDINPREIEGYNGLGMTYWYMDERELAVAAWEKSLSIQPESNNARGWMILSKSMTGS